MRLFCDVSERVSDPWLRRAFILAEQGRGMTSPNPVVGCVIVRDGKVVGEGYHARAGLPHAEVMALQAAGESARGATAYVTLEPCTHHGRTPPCTDSLIAAGISRVVIGLIDPNDSVSGGGTGALRAAGIDVIIASDPEPFLEQNEAWVASLGGESPFVRVKVAMSLDGHSALRDGERAGITGAAGAVATRVLRSRADAVLIGGATLRADDPALTVRDEDGRLANHQPVRVVLVREAMPDAHYRVFTDGLARTLVLAPPRLVGQARGGLPHSVETAEYDLELGLTGALRTLLGIGITDLLVEPGPRLFTALWDARAIDQLFLVQAGGVAGPLAPPSFLSDASLESADRRRLSHVMAAEEAGVMGDVAVTVWRPRNSVPVRRALPTVTSDVDSKEAPVEGVGR